MLPSTSKSTVSLTLPDLALQAAVCLDQYDALVGGQSLRALVLADLVTVLATAAALIRAKNDTLSTAVADLFPAPPAQVQTAGMCGSDNGERMGAWLVPVVAPQVILPQLGILPGGKLFAFEFSGDTIKKFFAAGWAALTAQNYRLNDHGVPDPSGRLELKEPASLTTPNPKTIELKVLGTYHYTLHIGKISIDIDVDFTFVSTETLSASPLGIQVSAVQNIDLDRGPIDTALAGAFFLTQFGGFFGAPTFAMIYSLVQDGVAAATGRAGLPIKIGGLIAPLFPQVVLIPKTTSKLLLTYDEVTADLGTGGLGIVASGSAQPRVVPRAPQLFIHGSSAITVNRAITTGPTIPASYNLAAADMRVDLDGAGNVQSPSSVTWTGGTVGSPSALSTSIQFDIGTTTAGHVVTRVVTATVTDSDGQVQSASKTVTITVVNRPPAHPPDGRPKPARTENQ
jgi:hypothetical protein